MTLLELDASYMRYIGELERQVKELERLLADCRSEAAARKPRARVEIDDVLNDPPQDVTADGTRGMVRGVSAPGRPIRGTGPKR